MSSYVYCVVAAEHPCEFDKITGVGDPPAKLRRIEVDALAAIVSDAPEGLRAKRRDLMAHEMVLERMCEQGVTLPMRFGFVAESDDSVAYAVAANAEAYCELLSDLDGRIEINVKATHHEDAVLTELLTADEELRAANDALRTHGGGQQERIKFGQRVAAALDIRRKADAERLLGPLRTLAVAESVGPEVDNCFVNTSFLVQRTDASVFDKAIRDLQGQLGAVMEISARGPLPPYSFTGPFGPGS